MNKMQWRCTECQRIVDEEQMLSATNPFNDKDEISGCPICKSVTDFEQICDEEGCKENATCGFPHSDGYRRTCREHYEKGAVKDE